MTGPERKAASHLVISDLHYLFFLGGLSFYLFLLAHISPIILHQPAATWGWADFYEGERDGEGQRVLVGCLRNHQKRVTCFQKVKGHSWHRVAVTPQKILAAQWPRRFRTRGGFSGLRLIFRSLLCIISCGFLGSHLPSHRFIMNAGNDVLILFTLKGSVVFIAFATKKEACGLIYASVNRAHFTSLCFIYLFSLFASGLFKSSTPSPWRQPL